MPKKTKKTAPASKKPSKPRAPRKPRVKKDEKQLEVIAQEPVIQVVLNEEPNKQDLQPIDTPLFKRIKYRVKKWWADWIA